MCCPLEMNYTTGSDALPWSSPRIILPRRRSTHITDRWREQCPPLTKVNCYSPAQHLVGALVCPPLTHCVHAHAHMYTCEWAHVNMREVKLRPRGAHSTPREHFRETLRDSRPEDRNLADERPSPCLLCCFTTPWLRTSAKQPQRPFVILMVTGGTLQLLTRTQSSDCAPRRAFKDRVTCGDAGKITGWRQPLKPQHLNAYKMSLQGHRTTLQTGFWLATASYNL